MALRVRAAFSRAAKVVGVGAIAASSAVAWTGCSSDDTGTGYGPVNQLGTGGDDATDSSTNGQTDGTIVSTSGGAMSPVRFAHLAAGVGGVDFCWRAGPADTFHGPILNTGSQAVDFDGGGASDDASTSADAASNDGGAIADADAGDAADGSHVDAGHDSGTDSGPVSDAGIDSGNHDAGPGADASGPAPDDAGTTMTSADSGASSSSSDGGAPPLTYLNLSRDVMLGAAGTIDLIAVEPGVGCGAPLVMSQVSITPSARTTLLLAGGAQADASGALGMTALVDEEANADDSQAGVRVVNAALSPYEGALAVSFESAGQDTPIATDVQPRSASSMSTTAPLVDGFGYASIAPLATTPGLRVIAKTTQYTWLSQAIPFPPAAASVHTAFVTEDTQGYVVLWCDDRVSPTCVALR